MAMKLREYGTPGADLYHVAVCAEMLRRSLVAIELPLRAIQSTIVVLIRTQLSPCSVSGRFGLVTLASPAPGNAKRPLLLPRRL